MTDPAVREIQLSRKQLAFGVISAVGLSVVIFLLGVSVGRGVLATSASATAATDRVTPAESTDATVETAATPASDAVGASAGSIPLKVVEPPSPPPEMPATNAAIASAEAPKSEAPAKPEAAAKSEPAARTPATKSTAAPPATTGAHAAAHPDAQKPPAPASAAHSDWFVQVGVFKSKENADRLASTLKGAGYAAFVLPAQAPALPYLRVRVGPFTDNAEAEKIQSRLIKEGYKPSVTR